MRGLMLLLLFYMTAGCAKIGVTKVGIGRFEAKKAGCHLDIYSSSQEIKNPYKVACLIDSRTGTTLFHDRSVQSSIEQAKKYACKCGANALLIEGVDTQGIGLSSWGMGKSIIKAIVVEE